MTPTHPFRPTTGLPGLDAVMAGIAPGDNIVWQIQSLDEYRSLVTPYAEASRHQQRPLIYFRFAGHSPLLADDTHAHIHTPDPREGFDAFVDQVHRVIEAAGTEAIYIFDCLSELAEVWQSNRMMANFFRLTCPRLFDLDTVTYFAILRNTHTRTALDLITETTQFLLDIFNCRGRHYIRPVKVRHDSKAVMNLIHAWEPGDVFRPVADSGTVAELLADSDWQGLETGLVRGYWERLFATARQDHMRLQQITDVEARQALEKHWCARLAPMLFPDDAPMARLIEQYIRLEDLIQVRKRMIGTGSIGGKALGMLLARAILRQDAPECHARLEAHDSFHVGTTVFDSFLVYNKVWWIRRQQREPHGFLQDLDLARERILEGRFPSAIIRQFEGMLDYFGEWPFIVRSSSRLEDRYGNAFAGQYDSVFCVNQGPRDKRLADLLEAVRQVYASTLSESALRYRQRRDLLDREEQMALLIMRVSGTAGTRYFHPHAAGVGLSINPYPWNPAIDMHAGVLRLVAGLGTRAVDRSDDDYTRLIALNAPNLRPESNFGAIARHAQRRMDTLDLQTNQVVSGPFAHYVSEQTDFPGELFTTRESPDRPAFLTFDGLISDTDFVSCMRTVLQTLHTAYQHAVETEFALNFQPDGAYRINLLQCRPMQVRDLSGCSAEPPAHAKLVARAAGAVIGPSRVIKPSRIVFISPSRFAPLRQADRLTVTRLVGRINRASADHCLLMLGPGRWGSRDPALGLPVAFAEINHVAALCEIVAMHENLVPDVSLGTHFLNELIEADMLYFALFPKMESSLLDEEMLRSWPNQLARIVPDSDPWAEVVHVVEPPDGSVVLYADAEQQRVIITLEP